MVGVDRDDQIGTLTDGAREYSPVLQPRSQTHERGADAAARKMNLFLRSRSACS